MQIRRYSTPIRTSYEVDEYDFDSEKDVEYSPFDGKKIRGEIEATSEDYIKKKAANRMRSLNRTKQKVYAYARSGEWEYFCTFTFDPKKVDSTSFEVASKKLRVWFNNQRRKYPDLKYLAIPEYHADRMKIHFHALVSGIPLESLSDSGLSDKSGNPIYNIRGWRYGFSTATKVKDTHRASNYITKYITKDFMDLEGKNRYFCSKGLALPKEELYLMGKEEIDDFVKTLANSLGKNIGYTKVVQPGTLYETKYIELNDDYILEEDYEGVK